MKNSFFTILFLLFSSLSFAETTNLSIKVTNISEATGTLFVTIYQNSDNWLKEEAFKDLRFPVDTAGSTTVVVEDIPLGTYAVSVFHDLNGNLDIDTNFIGIPKEPYGFSGEVGKFGPPKFDKASFLLEAESKELEIKLN